jgi:hypothetical protein
MDSFDQMTVDMAVMDFMRDHPNAPMAKVIHAAVTAAEPMIRADERERYREVMELAEQEVAALRERLAAEIREGDVARKHADILTDLRGKAEALPIQWKTLGAVWIRRDDVLALIDGSSDGQG